MTTVSRIKIIEAPANLCGRSLTSFSLTRIHVTYNFKRTKFFTVPFGFGFKLYCTQNNTNSGLNAIRRFLPVNRRVGFRKIIPKLPTIQRAFTVLFFFWIRRYLHNLLENLFYIMLSFVKVARRRTGPLAAL